MSVGNVGQLTIDLLISTLPTKKVKFKPIFMILHCVQTIDARNHYDDDVHDVITVTKRLFLI